MTRHRYAAKNIPYICILELKKGPDLSVLLANFISIFWQDSLVDRRFFAETYKQMRAKFCRSRSVAIFPKFAVICR